MESPFRIGEWLVEPQRDQLIGPDQRIKVEPRAMQLLVYLAEHPGEVVPRDRILEEVWEGAFVSDEVLTSSIRKLRKWLGDDAKDPHFIQTVPGKGYRLNASVHWANLEESPGGAPNQARQQGLRIVRWLVFALATVAMAAGLLSWLFWREPTPSPIRSYQFTSYPGLEIDPAISPSGNQVVFIWKKKEDGVFHLYVQQIGGSEPLQLTDAEVSDFGPAWSPDGSRIAFLRNIEGGIDGGKSDVVIVPALGGSERRVGSVSTSAGSLQWLPGLAWSPDGQFIAVPDRDLPKAPASIFLLSIKTGEKRKVSFPPPGTTFGDKRAAFSPDGNTVASLRMPGLLGNQIYLNPVDGGEPSLLLQVEGIIFDLEWPSEGTHIYYTSLTGTEQKPVIWAISAKGGTPHRLFAGERAGSFSIDNERGRLVHDAHFIANSNIWRLPGPASEMRDAPTEWIASTYPDWSVEYSPDGTKIAFVSQRKGSNNIWICNSEGRNCSQLTDLPNATRPRWSPDGRHIVFRCDLKDGSEIHVVEVETGFTRCLTQESSFQFPGAWSYDGEWIYYSSKRNDQYDLWKVSSKGGEAIRITRNGGFNPRLSEDGRYLYYADRWMDPSIRKVSVERGAGRAHSGKRAPGERSVGAVAE